MGFPSFASGDVLTATDMNAVGLWKVNAVSGTNVAALQWDNIFSSTYNSYRIVLQIAGRSTGSYMRIQWRNSGGNSNTNYLSKSLWYDLGLASSAFSDHDRPTDSVSIGPSGQQSASSWGIYTIDIGDAFAARYTTVTGGSAAVRSGTAAYATIIGSLQERAVSYTGLYLYASAGNFDYVATCYGYRN